MQQQSDDVTVLALLLLTQSFDALALLSSRSLTLPHITEDSLELDSWDCSLRIKDLTLLKPSSLGKDDDKFQILYKIFDKELNLSAKHAILYEELIGRLSDATLTTDKLQTLLKEDLKYLDKDSVLLSWHRRCSSFKGRA
jgi:hypothetical protein